MELEKTAHATVHVKEQMNSDTFILRLALNAVWKSVQFRYPECGQSQRLYQGGSSVLAYREKQILGMTTMHWNQREIYPLPSFR